MTFWFEIAPRENESDTNYFILDIIVKEGDVVKLDLGVHIDGYIAVVAHTVILSEDKKGKAVDALLAAHYCAEAALRLVAPGVEVRRWNKNVI